jgi:hypothetical protein
MSIIKRNGITVKPAEKTNVPCSECGTTRGNIPAGSSRPVRRKGLCEACYRRTNRKALAMRQAEKTNVPCAECATTGGYTPAWSPRPTRIRGLCAACYKRAYGRRCLNSTATSATDSSPPRPPLTKTQRMVKRYKGAMRRIATGWCVSLETRNITTARRLCIDEMKEAKRCQTSCAKAKLSTAI